jgi:hypothetical protein
MKKLFPLIALFGLLGAGCTTPAKTPASTVTPPAQVEAKNGFGKLPGLQPYGSLGTAEAISSRSAGAVAVGAPTAPPAASAVALGVIQGDAAVTNAGVATTMPARPYIRPEQKQVNVKYSVTASLPDWQSEADVLRIRRPSLDAGVVRALAVPAGLPSVLAGQIKQMQSVNMSWLDMEDYQWNFDPMYGNLNWWMQYDQRVLAEMDAARESDVKPPTVDKALVIAAADRFLDAHGLSALREQGGVIDELPPNGGVSDAPCLLKGAEPAVSGGAATTMMYPSPCGWYPTEVTVYYGTQLEGRSAVDTGGYPFRTSSVQVSLKDYAVRGGNVQMTQGFDRSSYALIGKDEALKRLQDGGRNPVYSWGGEGGDVDVKITKAELVWMRFDSWTNNKQESFYLPALAAEGTVDRKIMGQEPEIYRTVVPLVSDDAFDLGDQTTVSP